MGRKCFSKQLVVAGNSEGTGKAVVSLSVRSQSVAIRTLGWAHMTLEEACKFHHQLEEAIEFLTGRIGPPQE